MDGKHPVRDTAGRGTPSGLGEDAPTGGVKTAGIALAKPEALAPAEQAAFFELLSHELRTPATSIHAAAILLRTRAQTFGADTRRELVDDIADETERLLRVIDDLLVLSQLDAGLALAQEPLLLQRLVPSEVQQERRRRPHVPVGLLESGPLPVVRGDELGVRQIVRDLVSDVGRWRSREPVAVELGTADSRGAHVRVIHRDAATDVERSVAPTVWQGWPTPPRPLQGSIGQYTCARLARAMGGHSWARPRTDGGTERGLWLPAFAVGR
jgi:K+-sensing histidine kinase KdpD